jgi:hypothetical protein
LNTSSASTCATSTRSAHTARSTCDRRIAAADRIFRPDRRCPRRRSGGATSSADYSTNTMQRRETEFVHPTRTGERRCEPLRRVCTRHHAPAQRCPARITGHAERACEAAGQLPTTPGTAERAYGDYRRQRRTMSAKLVTAAVTLGAGSGEDRGSEGRENAGLAAGASVAVGSGGGAPWKLGQASG